MTNPLTAYINSLLDEAEARMDAAGIPGAKPKPVEYVDVVCGICAGWGHVHDGYRGSERNQMCRACAGKGTIVTEEQ
jgi:DnaJ-class molecular chaperone